MSSRQVIAVLGAAVALTLLTTGTALVRQSERHNALSSGELQAFLLQLAVAAPVAWLLWRLAPAEEAPRAPRPWLWSGVALGLALAMGAVRGWTHLTDDAHVYVFQAEMLLRGHLHEPALMPLDVLRHQFVVGWPQDASQWLGCYPLLAGAWTALGAAVGFPNLMWVLLAPATVLAGTWAARQLMPDGDISLVPVLLAISPALVGLASTLHTSSGVACLVIVLAGLLAKAWREPAPRGALMAGVGVTAALVVSLRPLEGALSLLVTASVLAAFARRDGVASAARRAVGIGLGAAPLAALWLGYNAHITGDPLSVPYDLLYGGQGSYYGFGETLWGEHTVANGLRKAAAVEVRMGSWAHAWPGGLGLILAGAALFARGAMVRWVCLLLAVHVLVYLPAPFGEVPSMGVSYSVVQVPVVTLLVVLAVRRAPRLRSVVLGLSLLGWAGVMPGHIGGLVHEASTARAPVERAAELVAEQGPIVVLHRLFITRPLTNYVHYPPPPLTADPDVLWVNYDGLMADGEAEGRERLRALAGDRAIVQMAWRGSAEDGLLVSPIELGPAPQP